MNPESVKEIIDYIAKTGELYWTQIYNLAYKQCLYIFFSNIFWIIVFAILFYLGSKIIVAKYKYDTISDYYPKNKLIDFFMDRDELFFMYCAIYVVGLAVVSFATLATIGTNINFLINPEWMVIKTILQSIGGN